MMGIVWLIPGLAEDFCLLCQQEQKYYIPKLYAQVLDGKPGLDFIVPPCLFIYFYIFLYSKTLKK